MTNKVPINYLLLVLLGDLDFFEQIVSGSGKFFVLLSEFGVGLGDVFLLFFEEA